MKVLVMNIDVKTRSFPSREGKPAVNFREQSAAIERPGQFPLPFIVSLEETQAPYPAGEYTIDPDSLQNNKFGGLEFGRRIVLIPIKNAASKAA